MTLEMEAIETSLAKLAPSGWKAGVAYDKEADRELMDEDRVEAQKRTERNNSSGFFSCGSWFRASFFFFPSFLVLSWFLFFFSRFCSLISCLHSKVVPCHGNIEKSFMIVYMPCMCLDFGGCGGVIPRFLGHF